ncbi:MAG: IS110 family transposase [Bacteroidales bacterium]|nr:IS110 family transposase [Bacteroidales bacterium]
MKIPSKGNYLLLASIKGLGMQTAVSLIVYTNNFINFISAHKSVCYLGGTLFEKLYDSSVKIKKFN